MVIKRLFCVTCCTFNLSLSSWDIIVYSTNQRAKVKDLLKFVFQIEGLPVEWLQPWEEQMLREMNGGVQVRKLMQKSLVDFGYLYIGERERLPKFVARRCNQEVMRDARAVEKIPRR